jgi:hypothetical protein
MKATSPRIEIGLSLDLLYQKSNATLNTFSGATAPLGCEINAGG